MAAVDRIDSVVRELMQPTLDRALATIGLGVLLVAGCSRRAPVEAPAGADTRVAIVASERGPQGARLVALDERGDRQFDLLEVPDSIARDSHPALSPDGAWIVFASSRGRHLSETSLWIAPLAPNAVPRRLTEDGAIDSHPVWTHDGSAIVFASTRDGGDFDIVSLRIDGATGQAIGEPVALTSGPAHEVTPAIARDGTIVYAAVTRLPDEGGASEGDARRAPRVESHLEARAPDGTITRVTDGPADTSPALSPDGTTLVFARPVEHDTGLDADLWTMSREQGASSARHLVNLPLTDESGPVWSPDGRYVFATSLLRGAAGNPLFSSVIVIDLRERPVKARVLQDRAGAFARLTPAIGRTPLDTAALAADPEYLPELARIMAREMAKTRDPSFTPASP